MDFSVLHQSRDNMTLQQQHQQKMDQHHRLFNSSNSGNVQPLHHRFAQQQQQQLMHQQQSMRPPTFEILQEMAALGRHLMPSLVLPGHHQGGNLHPLAGLQQQQQQLPASLMYRARASPISPAAVDTDRQQQQSGDGYRCPLCAKPFADRLSLQQHVLQQHEATGSDDGSLSSPSPPMPLQSLLGADGDLLHDPYRCDICGKTFAVPARLTRHYRTHTGEKPYQCEFCHKSFSVKENLSVHRRIHTKERPYKCEVCERAFEHSGKLHRHMRIHTGERPHCCSWKDCGKTFIQSGQLVIHMRTHTGDKPYVCQVCQKGFTCSKQLKVHSRTHTGEKPYACEICGKSFGYNHVLKLHQVAHFGEKVYKCTLCANTFTSKKSMESHIKSHAHGTGAGSPEPAQSPLMISPVMSPDAATMSSSDKENMKDADSASEWDSFSEHASSVAPSNLGGGGGGQCRSPQYSPSPVPLHIPSPVNLPPTPPTPDRSQHRLPPHWDTFNQLHQLQLQQQQKLDRMSPSLPPMMSRQFQTEFRSFVSSAPSDAVPLPPFSVAGALTALTDISITTVPSSSAPSSLAASLSSEPARLFPISTPRLPLALAEPSIKLFPHSLTNAPVLLRSPRWMDVDQPAPLPTSCHQQLQMTSLPENNQRSYTPAVDNQMQQPLTIDSPPLTPPSDKHQQPQFPTTTDISSQHRPLPALCLKRSASSGSSNSSEDGSSWTVVAPATNDDVATTAPAVTPPAAEADQIILPHRKRSKMILQALEQQHRPLVAAAAEAERKFSLPLRPSLEITPLPRMVTEASHEAPTRISSVIQYIGS